MDELPMPSDLRKAGPPGSANASEPMIEPPSVKLIVRLFLIPLLIVAGAVGVMFLIGLLAGREPTLEEAVARLRSAGGERTTSYLVGPASKQRYLDAKTLVDKMKAPEGLGELERINLAKDLSDILVNRTRPEEGEVQHFVLLALGRVWQKHPSQEPMVSAEAVESRKKVVDLLIQYMDAPQLPTKKAAILASVYLAGQPEVGLLVPRVIAKLQDQQEDIDVRIAAATALGPLGDPGHTTIISALNQSMNDSDDRHAELVWSSALSLAILNQPNVAGTILKLLDREELAGLKYYDREADPKNPTFRPLNDREQQRILINTMLGARHLDVPEVQARLKEIAEKDPSARVRAAAMQVIGQQR